MPLNEALASGVIAGSAAAVPTFCLSIPPWLTTDAAPCRTEPDLFFPEGYTRGFQHQVSRAAALCAECPLMESCYEWAVQRPGLDGIWAGTTPRQRVALRRGRK